MTECCTVIRTDERMRQGHEILKGLKAEYKNVQLSDTGYWTNQNLSFTRALGDMLIYAEAILVASIARTESRGSHYRPDFPDRDDANWHCTTVAQYDAETDEHTLEYEPIPLPLVEPRARTYGAVEAADGEDDKKPTATKKKKKTTRKKKRKTTTSK